MKISGYELKEALKKAKTEISEEEKKKRRIKRLAGLVFLGLTVLGTPFIPQIPGLVARANAPAQSTKTTTKTKKLGERLAGELPGVEELAKVAEAEKEAEKKAEAAKPKKKTTTKKEAAAQPVVEVKKAAPQETPFTSIRVPFNVDSRWTSKTGGAGTLTWQTNQGTINFGVEPNGRFTTAPGDTWFVYGWFGSLQQIKDINMVYPQWGLKHGAIDFAGVEGLDIVAAADGKVVYVGEFEGTSVIIKHSQGYFTTYSHLRDTTVSVGQQVRSGDLIGHLGNTGNTPNPHLHFEVTRREGDTLWAVNPRKFLAVDWSHVVIPNCTANQFYEGDRFNPDAQGDFVWNMSEMAKYGVLDIFK
jgi:murein DD-endopeptidase MepM/ murein hydrolase activator NlpD